MKKLLTLLALSIIFISCTKEEKKKTAPVEEVPLNERPIPPLQNSNAGNALNVVGGAHYICPSKCEGGTSSAQGNCPTCGLLMAHNQGYHTAQNTSPATPGTLNAPAAAAAATGPNANGQYHYTCSNGCAGGGDNAGKCTTCGGDLAHNQAYHN